MDDPHLPAGTPPPSSPSREGITFAVSLISAGAGLNSWFPAFKLLGAGLIVAGFAVLAGAIWPAGAAGALTWGVTHRPRDACRGRAGGRHAQEGDDGWQIVRCLDAIPG